MCDPPTDKKPTYRVVYSYMYVTLDVYLYVCMRTESDIPSNGVWDSHEHLSLNLVLKKMGYFIFVGAEEVGSS